MKKDVVVSLPHRAELGDIDCQSANDGMAKQEFAKDCDVNAILARCLRFGVPLPDDSVRAVFADVSEIGDFTQSMNRIEAGKEAFMSLSPDVRSRFNNDLSQLLAFLRDPSNLDECVKMGLVNPPKADVVPANPAVSPGTASA